MRSTCLPGDHVVLPNDAYGGTFRLFDKVEQPWGVEHTPAPVDDVEAVAAAVRPGQTKLVWLETPTNPLLNIGDIAALATVAHDAGALLVVDNTFASPYLQQPLTLGADVVVHSTTKYPAATPTSSAGRWSCATSTSPSGSPSTRTRSARWPARSTPGWCCGGSRRSASAWTATATTPSASSIPAGPRRRDRRDLPGPPRAPRPRGREPADERYGGMVSFCCAGGEAAALAVCERAQVFTLAESLGGIESLIEHPGRMTHASVAGTALEVPPDLVRLSVGIETVDDLLADLDHALS